MLDEKGFDLWADGYDASVHLSQEQETYPFAGYKAVLAAIYSRIMQRPGASVLDIGFGTAVLTGRLYESGCQISGFDFSQRMLEIAKEKMPSATLIQHDFTEGVPRVFARTPFDFIVSTYALHHLTDDEKATLLQKLQKQLLPGGAILIGDVAFETRAEQEACKRTAGDEWDEDEYYIAFDEFAAQFPSARFTKLSDCAGVIELPGSARTAEKSAVDRRIFGPSGHA